MHEEPAGSRLAAAACGAERGGQGLHRRAVDARGAAARPRRGQRAPRSRRSTALEGMSVFTLYDLQPVESGEPVARAKITPLAIPDRLVKDAESRAARAGGLVSVKPFQPHVLAALSRETPRAAAAPALRVLPDREGGLVRLAAPAGALRGRGRRRGRGRDGGPAGRGRRHPDRGGRRLARPAGSGVRRARAPGRPDDPARRAGPSGQPAVDRGGARAPGARHARLRHVLAGHHVRPGAAAHPGRAPDRARPRSPRSATAVCSRATAPTASRPIARPAAAASWPSSHGALQRRDPGALPPAALPRRDRAPGRGPRGREPALRRPRAHPGPARRRAGWPRPAGPATAARSARPPPICCSRPRSASRWASRRPRPRRACSSGSTPISGRHG